MKPGVPKVHDSLARRAGRPVKFIEDRVDNLTACENLAFCGARVAYGIHPSGGGDDGQSTEVAG
jgi:hypothetical protein